MSLMFFFSTDVFSGEHTARVIDWLMKLFSNDTNRPDLGETNFAVRKFAHFFEYAILSALLFRAFRAEHRKRWQWSWAVYSFSMVIAWSLLDEFHQTFTKTRGGSLYDSLLDSSGGLFALLVLAIYFHRQARRHIKA